MDHSDGQLKVAMGLEDIVNCPRSLIDRRLKPQPEQALKCPRCDSLNTKFCYYNNYSLSQPRYFCKACRRYWTKGGSLRNVPVGGGCRKNKRSNSKKAQDPAQSISDSSSLLPPTYDPVLSINIPNFPQDILAKPAVNPPFLTQFDPLRTGFHGLGITDLSLYSLPTGFHNPCSTFSHGNLKVLECGNTGSQILMHNSVENVQGVIGDDASKTRDGDSRAWGSQWQNGGRESGLEEGKDYWNGGAIGGVWNGMVSNYGPSSVSPFI